MEHGEVRATLLNTRDSMGGYELHICSGIPIMLLRSLDAPKLVNGTRLIVKKLFDNVILATIITGKYAGEDVFIPRIGLLPSNFLVVFKQTQFSIKPYFTLSVNKAQDCKRRFSMWPYQGVETTEI